MNGTSRTRSDRKPRVLFYEDSPVFGGHQKLSLEGIQYGCESDFFDTVCVFYEGNAQFAAALARMQQQCETLKLVPVQIFSRSLQPIRTLHERKKVQSLRQVFRAERPDVVVVLQGRIESGSLGLVAARKEGLKTISYIPMAHSVAVVSPQPWTAWFRDWLNRYYYRMPHGFITISESAKGMLRKQGATAPTFVVANGVEVPAQPHTVRESVRQALGLDGQYVIVVAGRIDFRQKCQDFVVESIQRFPSEFADAKVLFVGSGPDSGRLKRMIEDKLLQQNAIVRSWTDDMEEIYAAADVLVIPSKFEGVPLTMLEAMSVGIPVIGTNVDGMAEMLPPHWTFKYRDFNSFIAALRHVRHSDVSSIVRRNKDRVQKENSLAAFRRSFVNTIARFTDASGPTLRELPIAISE